MNNKIFLKSREKILDLSTPKIMGIVNLTNDSFSDGHVDKSLDSILFQIDGMIKSNVSLIDLGAESTRPKAIAVSLQKELDLLMDILLKVRKRFDSVWISIDTYKIEVMEESIKQGVDFINDIKGLDTDNKINLIKKSKVAACIMHMQNNPLNMQDNPVYDDVIFDIYKFFDDRLSKCYKQGVSYNQLCIDPGFGFGKNTEDNYKLLKNLSIFKNLTSNILIGISKKSMIGNILNKPISERLFGTVVANVIAIQNGANIIRVHDVSSALDTIKILNYLNKF